MKSFLKEFLQFKNLFVELVRKGIKLKYRRSYLGIIWSMIEPLLTMIVLALVFGTLFGYTDKSFPVYILAGRLIYSLFSQSTTAALKSIRQNEAMIKKVYIPKFLFPVSSVTFNYILFLVSIVVLAAVAVVLGVYPTFYVLLSIVPLAILFVFSVGIGMLLATLGSFFRDLEYLWNIALMLIMYASAIFYYPDKILDSNVSWLLKYNPLFCIIDNFRSCVFGEMMDVKMMTFSGCAALITLIIGSIVFEKNQNKFILYL